ncbi:hypothetical protein J2T09_002752 [Neorhizobium huautlense]|uniref:Lipoprotein n=1 Tax=Neorhizobium huautlense TaxID=67774 RepID=A0ABT9PU46_9HYPH|nr:hypothetical protein [Neorhizobium huautlense]MDP9837992.1 hypothetical protein [Neorhizobium huautlense]
MILTLAMSGCSLTAKTPEVAATAAPGPRASSAAEAMQQAAATKQQRQKNGASTYVDPLVSARPGQNQNVSQTDIADGQNVRDFRASGRSAMATMRSEKATSARQAQARNTATPSAVPELTESAMAGLVTQPTVIQAGRNSIFSAAAAPAADLTTASEPSASAQNVSSATGSLSTDAVAYAPVRRISGTTGGLFAGGPQMASNSDSANGAAPAAVNHTPPGIATRPAASATAEPVVQGLW